MTRKLQKQIFLHFFCFSSHFFLSSTCPLLEAPSGRSAEKKASPSSYASYSSTTSREQARGKLGASSGHRASRRVDSWVDCRVDSWVDCRVDSWVDCSVDSWVDCRVDSWVDCRGACARVCAVRVGGFLAVSRCWSRCWSR